MSKIETAKTPLSKLTSEEARKKMAVIAGGIVTFLLVQDLMPECPYCKSKLDVIVAGKGYTCIKCGHRVMEQPATKEIK